MYKLTPQAERLFPKAFEETLRAVLDTLAGELEPSQVENVLRAVGHRIAEHHAISWSSNGAASDLRSRLERAVAVLNDLGALVELEESGNSTSICGYICPLSDISVSHPLACRMTETLLSDLVGTPVHEDCERNEQLWCRFELRTATS